jgi:hypothetical protein
MSEPGDAMGPERATAPAPSPATPDASSGARLQTHDGAQDDRALRRAALRDLAALIGAEVFY